MLCVALGFLGAAAGVLYAKRYQPIYHSEAQVRVGDALDPSQVPGQQKDTSELADLPENLANGFRARFMVDPKLRAMAEEFGKDPALQHIGELRSVRGRDELMEHIRVHAQVEPMTRRVFRIVYDGHDAVLVQKVVQRLAELGVQDVQEERVRQAHQAAEFLGQQADAARQMMLKSETEVVKFLGDHPKIAVDKAKLGLSEVDKLVVGANASQGPGLPPVKAHEVSSMSPVVRGYLQQRAEVEARVARLEAALKFDPVQTKINEIDRLQQQLGELRAQSYTPEYPEYQRIARDIDRLQGEIREYKRRRNTDQTQDLKDLQDARVQLAALDQQIKLSRDQAVPKAPPKADAQGISAEAEFLRLTKDMTNARTAFEKLHDREQDAQLNEELTKVKGNLAARIEEPAKLPLTPRGVSRKVMAALCMLLGFGVGIILGAARAITDPHIYTVYDLAKASRLLVMGRVPQKDGVNGELSEVSGDDVGLLPAANSGTPSTILRLPESGALVPGTVVRAGEAVPSGPVPMELSPGGSGGTSGRTRAPTGTSGPNRNGGGGEGYVVVYSGQNEQSGQFSVRPGTGEITRPGGDWDTRSSTGMRSRSAILASTQSAAFRLGAMGHNLHQGTLPDADPTLFLLSAADGARAEQWRLVRCRLQDAGDPRVLVVSSALTGEGKTVAAANLALAYAEGGAHSVVMIDANLSSPRLTQIFGAKVREEALVEADMISAGLDVWQYAQNLFLVPALGPRGKRSAVLSSPAFGMLLADLRQSFDYIIIDAPAAQNAADAKIVLRNADAGLFLTRARSTTNKAVRIALDRLGRGVMAGAVLNEFGEA